jgi:hypothetical protein
MLLNSAISDLQSSTNALESYISKVDSLERDFTKWVEKVATKDDLQDVRLDFKSELRGIRDEAWELKERLVGLGMTGLEGADFRN